MARNHKKYEAGKTSLTRGDLIFFNGAAHVALATGKKDEVDTFWPPPDNSAYHAGTVDKVKTSTISALSDWMKNHFGHAPVVEFGAPVW